MYNWTNNRFLAIRGGGGDYILEGGLAEKLVEEYTKMQTENMAAFPKEEF